MRQKASFHTPGGDVTLQIDIDIEGTHKQVREAIEAVFADSVEVMRRKAISLAPNAVFKVDGQTEHLKSVITTARIKTRGKNITSKTDKFLLVAGQGIYPDKPKSQPVNALAKAAHIELGTVRNAPMPFMYPAFDSTRSQILSNLEGVV